MKENLNHQVIKIFIEGWLVRYHNFKLMNDKILRETSDKKILFDLDEEKLILKDMGENHLLWERELSQDLDAQDCLSCAMEVYISLRCLLE